MSDYSRTPSPEEDERKEAFYKLHNTRLDTLVKNGLTFAELKGLLYSDPYSNEHPDTKRMQELTGKRRTSRFRA